MKQKLGSGRLNPTSEDSLGMPENLGMASFLDLCKHSLQAGLGHPGAGLSGDAAVRPGKRNLTVGAEETQAQDPSDQLHRGRKGKFRLQEREKAGRNRDPHSTYTSVGEQGACCGPGMSPGKQPMF